MFDEDTDEGDEFDDPFDGDGDDDGDSGNDPEPAKPAAKKSKPAAKPAEPVDPTLETLAKIGLDSVKKSWIDEAKEAGVVAVDFDAIPMEGLDEEAKVKFIETAKANEATERARLEALGFTYNPGQTQADAEKAAADAADAEAQIAWGKGGPVVLPSGNEENDKKIQEAASRGDVSGVIKNLGGLGDFIMGTNRRG